MPPSLFAIIFSLIIYFLLLVDAASDGPADNSTSVTVISLESVALEAAGVYIDNRNTSVYGKTIVVTSCNYGYINHLHNLKCFLDRLALKVSVFAFDENTYYYIGASMNASSPDAGSSRFIPYLWSHGDQTSAEESVEWGNPKFNQIANEKLESVLALMELGYNVFFVDTDIAIPRDPMPFILWENVDYVHSINKPCYGRGGSWDFYKDGKEGNTGLYFVRSTNQTIKLWQDIIASVPKYPNLDDQTIFWNHMRSKSIKDPPRHPLDTCRHVSKSSLQGNEVVSCPLDECLFTCGALSAESGGSAWDQLQGEMTRRNETLGPVTVHANYMVGNAKKMRSLARRGYWLAIRQPDGGFRDGACRPYIDPRTIKVSPDVTEDGALAAGGAGSLDLKYVQDQLIKSDAFSLFLTHKNRSNAIEASIVHFANNTFRSLITNEYALVYPVACQLVNPSRLGECLGRYFQALGMAMEARLHFIALPPSYQYFKNGEKGDDGDPGNVFFSSLMITRKHSHPRTQRTDRTDIVVDLRRHIQTNPIRYADEPWARHLHLCKEIMSEALNSMFKKPYNEEKRKSKLFVTNTVGSSVSATAAMTAVAAAAGAVGNNITAASTGIESTPGTTVFPAPSGESVLGASASPSSSRSIFADVIILFRCRDDSVLDHGFLNFNLYPMLIPPDVKSIYILPDPASTCSGAAVSTSTSTAPSTLQNANDSSSTSSSSLLVKSTENSGGGAKFVSQLCQEVLVSLMSFLKSQYREAFVGVPLYSNDDTMDVLVQIANAPTVISSPSELAFWAMLGNRGGELYFPLSEYIMGRKPKFISDNFFWLSYPKLEYISGTDVCTESSGHLLLSRPAQSSSGNRFTDFSGRLHARHQLSREKLIATCGSTENVRKYSSQSSLGTNKTSQTHNARPGAHKKTSSGRQGAAVNGTNRAQQSSIENIFNGLTSGSIFGLGRNHTSAAHHKSGAAGITSRDSTKGFFSLGGGKTKSSAATIDLNALQMELIKRKAIDILADGRNEIAAAVDTYEKNRFQDIIGDEPIFVFPLVLREESLGNYFGRYFQALGMAIEARLHFITIPLANWEFLEATASSATGSSEDEIAADNPSVDSRINVTASPGEISSVASSLNSSSSLAIEAQVAHAVANATITAAAATTDRGTNSSTNSSITGGALQSDNSTMPSAAMQRRNLRRRLQRQQRRRLHQASKIEPAAVAMTPTRAFFESFVITRVHPNPTKRKRADVASELHSYIEDFPWEHSDEPWSRHTLEIREIFATAVNNYIARAYPGGRGMHIPLNSFELVRGIAGNVTHEWGDSRDTTKETDYKNTATVDNSTITNGSASATADVIPAAHAAAIAAAATTNALVPLIPDVVIKLRCNDVIQFRPGERSYGFLNFNVYKMIIPKYTRSIHILSESRFRNMMQKQGDGHRVNTTFACQRILTTLVDYLSADFPGAFIGIHRGGYVLDAMIQLARAPIVISSLSTFAFWPMIANRNSQLFFPLTHLILGRKPRFVAENFYWLAYPHQHTFGHLNFGETGVIDKVVAELQSFPVRTTSSNFRHSDIQSHKDSGRGGGGSHQSSTSRHRVVHITKPSKPLPPPPSVDSKRATAIIAGGGSGGSGSKPFNMKSNGKPTSLDEQRHTAALAVASSASSSTDSQRIIQQTAQQKFVGSVVKTQQSQSTTTPFSRLPNQPQHQETSVGNPRHTAINAGSTTSDHGPPQQMSAISASQRSKLGPPGGLSGPKASPSERTGSVSAAGNVAVAPAQPKSVLRPPPPPPSTTTLSSQRSGPGSGGGGVGGHQTTPVSQSQNNPGSMSIKGLSGGAQMHQSSGPKFIDKSKAGGRSSTAINTGSQKRKLRYRT